ncbi:Uncharacterized protein APZ42_027537 [Daphnia magna]|uniref:Uncharacterized protein n=1 Tax=Daphnia magna TaxID=35525 RepID=A0A164R9S1_9CRUS|nr:Uncharacterized protein APZ42_027537 [Daphnia magna]
MGSESAVERSLQLYYKHRNLFSRIITTVSRNPVDTATKRYRFRTSRPVTPIENLATSGYDPRPIDPSRSPSIPLIPSVSSDDWIRRRTPPAMETALEFSQNWLMNALAHTKRTQLNGDPKEWPTFISSFREMIYNVVPSDAQHHAFFKQLFTTKVRSYIANNLENPSCYYDALEELKKRYGQPQIVARSHLMTLMSFTSIRDDNSQALAKLNQTIHGATHALRTMKKTLAPQVRSSWGVKVYRMTPTRATIKDLEKLIYEMVMGEWMTMPLSIENRYAIPICSQ